MSDEPEIEEVATPDVAPLDPASISPELLAHIAEKFPVTPALDASAQVDQDAVTSTVEVEGRVVTRTYSDGSVQIQAFADKATAAEYAASVAPAEKAMAEVIAEAKIEAAAAVEAAAPAEGN